MILNYAYSYVIRYLGTLHADNRYTDKQWLLHHRHIMDSCREHWGAGYKAAAPVGLVLCDNQTNRDNRI